MERIKTGHVLRSCVMMAIQSVMKESDWGESDWGESDWGESEGGESDASKVSPTASASFPLGCHHPFNQNTPRLLCALLRPISLDSLFIKCICFQKIWTLYMQRWNIPSMISSFTLCSSRTTSSNISCWRKLEALRAWLAWRCYSGHKLIRYSW